MYVDDPKIVTPPDAAKIWRYMTFAKFMSMLDNSALWFARIGTFEDAYEGTLSVPATTEFVKDMANKRGMPDAEADHFFQLLQGALNSISRMSGFANCWHLNEGESAAFWKVYSEEGVAVQSSIGRLKQAFPNTGWPKVRIGQVDYVENPEDEITDNRGREKPILTKGMIYDYEREIRAFFFDDPEVNKLDDLLNAKFPAGHAVHVNLNTMIERIYVAPRRPSWFKSLVESVCAKNGHGIKSVTWSRIGERPVFWRDPLTQINDFRGER